eukprot:GGOE01045512.1.p1 GENE.GGOE01045512.1~~GGOE01045512.1.p1  ORF type:complete len:773 (-),score=212.33 GGOE01045512.1:235-2487(-)
MTNVTYGDEGAEWDIAMGRIHEAMTDTICRLLAMQHPERGEAYFRDMVLAQGCALPAQRAAALSKLALGKEQHAEQRVASAALRLIEVRARLMDDICSVMRNTMKENTDSLLQVLGPPPQPIALCPVPPQLTEVLADLTGAAVHDVLGVVEAAAAEAQGATHPHLGLLGQAADQFRKSHALLGMGGSGGVEHAADRLAEVQLSDWSAERGPCPADRVAPCAEIQSALEAHVRALQDLQARLASAREQRNKCNALQRLGEDLTVSKEAALQQVRGTREYCTAVGHTLAGWTMEQEVQAREEEATRRACTDELQARYRRIEELQKALADEHLQAQVQEEELLLIIARQHTRSEAEMGVPTRLAAWAASAQAAGWAWEAEAEWTDMCHAVFDRILGHCTTQLRQYEEQVTSQLEHTQEAHWLTFTRCCQFVEQHLAQAQRRLLAGAQALQRREAEFAQWRQLCEREAAGPEEREVLQRGEARWQLDVQDMHALQAAREREVASWLEVRAAICQDMELTGTKEALAQRPHGRELVEPDPRETFGRTHRHLECQAAVQRLLQLMRQTHDRFAEFYEEVRMAEGWEGSWTRLAESCVALQRWALQVSTAKEEETASASRYLMVSSIASQSEVPFPVDLDVYLRANPFLVRQLADCQLSLRDDQLVHGLDVGVAWKRPCPGDVGEDLLTVWTSMLSILDGLLEPVSLPRPNPGASSTSMLRELEHEVMTIQESDSMSHTSGDSFFDLTARVNTDPAP